MDFLIQLLPLTLVILIGLGIWYFVRRNRLARPSGAPLEGFGGWLLLVAIGQWLGILRMLGEIAMAWPDYVNYWSNPVMKLAITGDVVLLVAMIAFMLYTAAMMTGKRRNFPALFRTELVLIVAFPVMSVLWVSVATGISFAQMDLASEIVRTLVAMIGATIWFLYSLKSVRVRNTFVH